MSVQATFLHAWSTSLLFNAFDYYIHGLFQMDCRIPRVKCTRLMPSADRCTYSYILVSPHNVVNCTFIVIYIPYLHFSIMPVHDLIKHFHQGVGCQELTLCFGKSQRPTKDDEAS